MKHIWMFYAAENEVGMQCALQIAGDPDSDEPMRPEYEGWHPWIRGNKGWKRG